MTRTSRGSWGQGELYEALCLTFIGICVWTVGTNVGLFDIVADFVQRHRLSNLLMLGFCMNAGWVGLAVRKSIKLRQEMRARDTAEQQADDIARHDELTGLANRRLFKEVLQARAGGRHVLSGFSVFLIDLDRFKPVNDVHGHAAGDVVLYTVAQRLQSVLPKGSVAARLGGDEFAAFVQCDEKAALTTLAEQLIEALSAAYVWGHTNLDVSATVGIAVSPYDGTDAEALLHAADVAMYRGKKEGRCTFRFFEAAMDRELKARAELEDELRLAIEAGEIEPYYQPLVSLPSRELLGFEVLARWRHPTRGLLSPSVFIPIAEETGLVAELSYRLLRRACLEAKAWPAHLHLAINIAPRQLKDQWMPERILGVLAETGFAPSRLEVEVTETALVEDLDSARDALQSLRHLGVRVALDDFGTGYSSLYHLRELRFDKLKIDRSYVQSLANSPESAKIVDAIINLGRSLGVHTTAEGIETVEDLNWLAEKGCNFGQGYLFGAPMPRSAADGLFNGHSSSELVLTPVAAAA
jgi:diguanylate cyclase (GGDEF)-like protein